MIMKNPGRLFSGSAIHQGVLFLQDVRSELNKVSWPTKHDVVKLTGIVIAVSLLIGAYIGTLDLLFAKVTDVLVKR